MECRRRRFTQNERDNCTVNEMLLKVMLDIADGCSPKGKGRWSGLYQGSLCKNILMNLVF